MKDLLDVKNYRKQGRGCQVFNPLKQFWIVDDYMLECTQYWVMEGLYYEKNAPHLWRWPCKI